jgi:Uma2 family endonuclease
MALPAGKIYTPEEYVTLERKSDYKSEYVNGEILAMSGASAGHTRIQMRLYTEVDVRLRGSSCEPFTADMRVQTSATHYCYPDFSIVYGQPLWSDQQRDTLLNPILIVEILSASTQKYDRGLKFERYKRIESLREYVLVSQDEARIECFLLRGKGWEHSVIEGLESSVRFDSIGIELALALIYERVELP